MQSSFGTVVIVICVVAVIIAVVALATSGRTWAEHGKGGMVMDRDLPRGPAGSVPSSAAERETEIRELLEARNARRARRGEEPLDVERELARLTAPGAPPRPDERAEPAADADADTAGVDPTLREEVRQLVVARNHRRVRAGKPPLDVDAEVQRELRRVREL